MGDAPVEPGAPELSEAEKNLVMHVCLEITAGHKLMGSDAATSMHFKLNQGNNVYINVEPDTKEEADRLFAALSVNGVIEMPMADMFWGDYFGSFRDQFGINWMINIASK